MKYGLKSLIRFAPDDGQGSGGDGQGGSGSDDNSGIMDGLQRLIDKQGGDASAVAAMLFSENYQLRERNRQLRGQIPGSDSLILDKDQAALWQTYQTLGDPNDLRTALSERDQAQGDLAQMRSSATIREAADTAGYKPSVLAGLDRQSGGALKFETREVDRQDGTKVKVAYVQNGDDQAVPLSDYAKSNWADFLPALQVESQEQRRGTRYPPQSSGGKPPASDLVDTFLQEQDEANKRIKNPLLRE